MSSDRPPGSLVRLEERLRDRFEWGLTVELEAPDLRTRVALLWRFASRRGRRAARAGRAAPDRRPRARQRAAARGRAHSRPRRLLRLQRAACRRGGRAGARPSPRQRSPRRAPSSRPASRRSRTPFPPCLGIPRADLLSAKRTPAVARARHLAMFLSRELTPLSLSQIAREFDRDHSTVHPCDPRRRRPERARLRHRRGYPQRPCSPGGNSAAPRSEGPDPNDPGSRPQD